MAHFPNNLKSHNVSEIYSQIQAKQTNKQKKTKNGSIKNESMNDLISMHLLFSYTKKTIMKKQ